MDAVAGDDDIALRHRAVSTVRAHEMRGHLAAALLDAGAAVPGEKILRADPLAHRAEQHPLQVGPQQRDVRPLVTGRLAERLAVDQSGRAG